MKCDQFIHTWKFIQFKNNENPPGRMTTLHSMLWKLKRVFQYINNVYSTLHYRKEKLAVNNIIMKFKETMVSWQRGRSVIELYKLCNSKWNITTPLISGNVWCCSGVNPAHGSAPANNKICVKTSKVSFNRIIILHLGCWFAYHDCP
jgi:hypothetical protein